MVRFGVKILGFTMMALLWLPAIGFCFMIHAEYHWLLGGIFAMLALGITFVIVGVILEFKE